jgi:predicted nucleic acid-binding Zn ribbon protein
MKTSLTNRVPLYPGTCEVCGRPCEVEDATCSFSCEASLVKREKEQGGKVLRLLKRWRRYRGRKGTPGEGALSEAAAMIDLFLREDRETRIASTKRRDAAKGDADEAGG